MCSRGVGVQDVPHILPIAHQQQQVIVHEGPDTGWVPAGQIEQGVDYGTGTNGNIAEADGDQHGEARYQAQERHQQDTTTCAVQWGSMGQARQLSGYTQEWQADSLYTQHAASVDKTIAPICSDE